MEITTTLDPILHAAPQDGEHLFEQCSASLWEQDYSQVQTILTAITQQTANVRDYFRSHPEALQACLRAVRITNVNAASVAMHQATHKADLYRPFTDFVD